MGPGPESGLAQSLTEKAEPGCWEDFWRNAEGDREVMGGARQRPTLEAFWSAILDRAGLGSSDLVLDIASGAAPVARLAAARLEAGRRPRFVCADYAVSALAAARAAAGADVLPVAADARRPPFRLRSFPLVVSQYGIEYAGEAAFAAAAELVAEGGALAAIVHYRGGVIALECAENARIARAALDSGFLAAARHLFEAGGVRRRPGDGADGDAADAVRRAFAGVGAMLKRSPPSVGRDLIARYAGDAARLVARGAAYKPEEALSWLDEVGARIGAYERRMAAMVAAARSEAEMAAIAARLAGAGLRSIDFAPLKFEPDRPPGAWKLAAHRP